MLSRTLIRTASIMASRAGVSSARVISSTMRSRSSVVSPVSLSSSVMNTSAKSSPAITGSSTYSPLRSFASATSSTANSSSAAAGMSAAAAAVKTPDGKTPDMFCFQCEQTDQGTGCTKIGVCGKTPETAALQDALVEAVKHISVMARNIRESNQTLSADAQNTLRMTDRFVLDALFSTLTNVNFDADRFVQYMQESTRVFQQLEGLHRNMNLQVDRSVQQSWNGRVHATKFDKESLVQLGKDVGVLPHRAALSNNADIAGLIEMCMYGIKGAAAYAHHALVNGVEDAKTYIALENALARLAKPTELTVPDLLGLALEIGGINLQVMENLDKSSTKRWGNPEPTQVSLDPVPGKAILVSGHDLVDLEEILKQTEGTGINVYTHGEMLPGHSYPGLKKYKHLVGHYGGAWQLQKFDFGTFPGAIIMTSNCIIEPRKSYKTRIFTRQMVGWPGVVHIPGDQPDFTPAIKAAQEAPGFVAAAAAAGDSKKPNNKTLTIGFGHHTVLSIADKVVDAVKKGQISRFFLIGGCDGSESERSYFSELAKSAPESSVILTLGCGKFRVNQLGLGDIGGIPRVLDMGQCNDSYSAIQVAVALAKAFNTDVNSLPLSMAISWFEQKAVAVLLTLLHLGVKNIRLGPALPAFVTPSVLNILVEKFAIKPIGKVKDDLPKMLMNQ